MSPKDRFRQHLKNFTVKQLEKEMQLVKSVNVIMNAFLEDQKMIFKMFMT